MGGSAETALKLSVSNEPSGCTAITGGKFVRQCEVSAVSNANRVLATTRLIQSSAC